MKSDRPSHCFLFLMVRLMSYILMVPHKTGTMGRVNPASVRLFVEPSFPDHILAVQRNNSWASSFKYWCQQKERKYLHNQIHTLFLFNLALGLPLIAITDIFSRLYVVYRKYLRGNDTKKWEQDKADWWQSFLYYLAFCSALSIELFFFDAFPLTQ